MDQCLVYLCKAADSIYYIISPTTIAYVDSLCRTKLSIVIDSVKTLGGGGGGLDQVRY